MTKERKIKQDFFEVVYSDGIVILSHSFGFRVFMTATTSATWLLYS